MTTRLQSIELLNQTHTFPGPVMLKVICVNRAGVELEIAQILAALLELEELPCSRSRQTPSAHYIAVTVEPVFDSAERVLEAYQRLRSLPGVVLLL
jgi:hypothetical protein